MQMRRPVFSILLLALALAGPFGTNAKSKAYNMLIDGIPIPASNDSFDVLWRGKTTCMVFSGTVSEDKETALLTAQLSVISKATDLLLTMAYAPKNMVAVSNGFRLVGKPTRGRPLAMEGDLTIIDLEKLPNGTWSVLICITMPQNDCTPVEIRKNSTIPGSHT
jgi:hypothetical protein